ncbi:MAG TPA: hypothetical protein GXZ27_09285 [Thermoanaerobacterales bacterium]|jgi:hypothetical protein|nr:hypothetical protein [Thermoanaerobacterales bacterium]
MMLYVDIIIAILIGAIILNLYLFRFEYKRSIIALWSEWSKNVFNKIHTKRKLPQNDFCNDKENDVKIDTNLKNGVSDTSNIDTSNSSISFNKPKVIYKKSLRVIKNTQPKYHFCATCGKIKIKDKQ